MYRVMVCSSSLPDGPQRCGAMGRYVSVPPNAGLFAVFKKASMALTQALTHGLHSVVAGRPVAQARQRRAVVTGIDDDGLVRNQSADVMAKQRRSGNAGLRDGRGLVVATYRDVNAAGDRLYMDFVAEASPRCSDW